MATSKFYVFLMFSTLILFKITADSLRQEQLEVSDSVHGTELERLKAKLSSLESIIDEINLQIRSNDDIIPKMDTIIQEKMDSVRSSLSKMSLQEKVQKARLEEASSVSEEPTKEQARSLLQVIAIQLNNFQSFLLSCLKNQGSSAWRLTVKTVSEKSLTVLRYAQRFITTVVMEWMPIMMKQFVEFASHLKPVGRFFILKTVDAYYKIKSFMVALIVRIQREVTAFIQEQGSSLLQVIAIQLNNFQSFLLSCWKNQGSSAWRLTVKTVSEKALTVQRYAQMLITTVITEWMPIMMKQFVVFASHLEPVGRFFILKSVDAYYKIKSFTVSLILTTQREVIPFFQEARKFAEPHVNHIAMSAKAYLVEAYITMQEYIRKHNLLLEDTRNAEDQ